jgi:hypothetical protein
MHIDIYICRYIYIYIYMYRYILYRCSFISAYKHIEMHIYIRRYGQNLWKLNSDMLYMYVYILTSFVVINVSKHHFKYDIRVLHCTGKVDTSRDYIYIYTYIYRCIHICIYICICTSKYIFTNIYI